LFDAAELELELEVDVEVADAPEALALTLGEVPAACLRFLARGSIFSSSGVKMWHGRPLAPDHRHHEASLAHPPRSRCACAYMCVHAPVMTQPQSL